MKLTDEQTKAIAAKVNGMTLPRGLGTKESACSIAAINLALTGRLTDEIPECMSRVVGRWIIVVQDAMPDEMRNSASWKSLLPLAAGTGRDFEQERLEIILDWMWGTVLPSLQAQADAGGYGREWRAMCAERTEAAAGAAWAAWAAAGASEAAGAAAGAAEEAAESAAWAAWAAGASKAAGAAAWAAEAAAWAEAEAAAWAAEAAAWESFDPCGLLTRLVEVGR